MNWNTVGKHLKSVTSTAPHTSTRVGSVFDIICAKRVVYTQYMRLLWDSQQPAKRANVKNDIYYCDLSEKRISICPFDIPNKHFLTMTAVSHSIFHRKIICKVRFTKKTNVSERIIINTLILNTFYFLLLFSTNK